MEKCLPIHEMHQSLVLFYPNHAFKVKNHILIYLYALVIIIYHINNEYENICKSFTFFTPFHGSFHKSVTMALVENLRQSPWQLPKSGHMT